MLSLSLSRDLFRGIHKYRGPDKCVDFKGYMSHNGHMTKINREQMYQLASEALAERIEQLIKQRERQRLHRKKEKKNVSRKK